MDKGYANALPARGTADRFVSGAKARGSPLNLDEQAATKGLSGSQELPALGLLGQDSSAPWTQSLEYGAMTKQDLVIKLHQLDPGATLTVEEGVLAQAFGADTLSTELIEAIENFALEQRCTFSQNEHGRHLPTFEKDDIF